MTENGSRGSTAWLALRSLLWAALLPGFFAGYVPWRYFGLSRVRIDVRHPSDIAGLACIALGVALLAACIWEFARRGRGTLSPVDPPRQLVIQGLYRYVRNPMYLSVTTIILGELLLTRSRALFVYWVMWFVAVNIFVMGYEEPALRRQFGASYEDYTRRVHRWLPRLLLLAVATAATLQGCVRQPRLESAPDAGARTRDRTTAHALGARFDSLRQARHIPGLAVVVLSDTTVVFARGYGYADLAARRPVTVETPFNIASVTKPIAAVVALRLVEQGTLDLDRPMRRYRDFSEFCTDAREQGGIFWGDYACEGDALTLRNVLSMTANGTAPGRRFLYNPPSFSWASRPMTQMTGVAFSTLVDSLVFRPAGMRRSARIHRALPLREDLARELALPYATDSLGRHVQSTPPDPQGDGAAGGVISTAVDLARFDIALTTDRLITPASREIMWTPGRSASGATLPYGLGWFVTEYRGERVVWHTGLWEERYSALYAKIPARSLTLILLANSDGLKWESRLDEAVLERSPFATAFLEAFAAPR